MSEETTQQETAKPAVVNAAYVVVLNNDGSISTTFLKPGSPVYFEVERAVTTYDVFSSSKEIVEEIQSNVMADRVAKAVLSQILPKDPEADAKARIAAALAERKTSEDNKLGE